MVFVQLTHTLISWPHTAVEPYTPIYTVAVAVLVSCSTVPSSFVCGWVGGCCIMAHKEVDDRLWG